jgi:hypothetical protein
MARRWSERRPQHASNRARPRDATERAPGRGSGRPQAARAPQVGGARRPRLRGGAQVDEYLVAVDGAVAAVRRCEGVGARRVGRVNGSGAGDVGSGRAAPRCAAAVQGALMGAQGAQPRPGAPGGPGGAPIGRKRGLGGGDWIAGGRGCGEVVWGDAGRGPNVYTARRAHFLASWAPDPRARAPRGPPRRDGAVRGQRRVWVVGGRGAAAAGRPGRRKARTAVRAHVALRRAAPCRCAAHAPRAAGPLCGARRGSARAACSRESVRPCGARAAARRPTPRAPTPPRATPTRTRPPRAPAPPGASATARRPSACASAA